MNTQPWKFILQIEEATRLTKLLGNLPFKRVAEEIATRMTVLCCHRDQIEDSPYSRVVYCVKLDRDLFDQFFNSQSGYRAAYFCSPWEGLAANSMFSQLVLPKLISSTQSSTCGLSEEFIGESLMTPSAKVWLAEHGKEVKRDCATCQGEWSTSSAGDPNKPEIFNDRWEAVQNVKANWGAKAPYLTKLRISGAFLDERFSEFVPFDKRFRAMEIHKFGWS